MFAAGAVVRVVPPNPGMLLLGRVLVDIGIGSLPQG